MTVINRRPHRSRQLLDAASFWHSLRAAPAWQLVLALSGWITMTGIVLLPPGSPPRLMLVFGFVLVCPGFAVSGLLPLRELAERWVLAIALSTSFAILITVALTVLRIDSVTLRMGLLALITTLAVLIDIRLRPRGMPSIPQEG
ncbi:MAG: hypothetical protein ACRDUW_03335 [Pseudonocardiaceae bacterium]